MENQHAPDSVFHFPHLFVAKFAKSITVAPHRQPGSGATGAVEPGDSTSRDEDDITSGTGDTISGDGNGKTSNATLSREKRWKPRCDDARTLAANSPKLMLDRTDYTVGWICAITTEYIAAQEFLDEEHEGPE
ncbi:hypothetical protein MHUMG1_08910 [Metarhizium humberi]|uniref:Uncharacterized protein n=1 Tax=Metarhizium humberi TaxID=2596975 RepID=A0A9P8M474_9HYPO|nr:hypothetical protein MHUMG1_08910 [Metarhizium humberi]